MMGMLEYIHETPTAVRHMVSRMSILLRDALQEIEGKEIHEIILCGSGTSYNAALAAAYPMQEILGIRVNAVYPVPFADRGTIVDEHTLVIGISQAGQSASTVKAMRYAKEHGFKKPYYCNFMGDISFLYDFISEHLYFSEDNGIPVYSENRVGLNHSITSVKEFNDFAKQFVLRNIKTCKTAVRIIWLIETFF